MKRYHENFNEFGELRESHSPWTLPDLLIVVLSFLCILALVLGVL
jgi:hypothetical protein